MCFCYAILISAVVTRTNWHTIRQRIHFTASRR